MMKIDLIISLVKSFLFKLIKRNTVIDKNYIRKRSLNRIPSEKKKRLDYRLNNNLRKYLLKKLKNNYTRVLIYTPNEKSMESVIDKDSLVNFIKENLEKDVEIIFYSSEINKILLENSIVLVPCKGFNKNLFRVGSGFGYFDKLFHNNKDKNFLKIGISYRNNLYDYKEDTFDIPMDYMITDDAVIFKNNIFNFNQSSARNCFTYKEDAGINFFFKSEKYGLDENTRVKKKSLTGRTIFKIIFNKKYCREDFDNKYRKWLIEIKKFGKVNIDYLVSSDNIISNKPQIYCNIEFIVKICDKYIDNEEAIDLKNFIQYIF